MYRVSHIIYHVSHLIYHKRISKKNKENPCVLVLCSLRLMGGLNLY